MKKSILVCYCTCISLWNALAQDQKNQFHPGEIWYDLSNQPINAHGGGILEYKQVYYWFGEIKKGKTWKVPNVNTWEDYRVKAGGVSCYSSTDLIHWKNLGVALAPETDDAHHDLHTSKVIERPKVIYNELTHHFVMWMHIDKDDYSYAHMGVAISTRPEGPYIYLGSMRPNGQSSRDMTLFKDDDGKAYLIYSSEDNKTMQICLLTEDYLKPTTTYKRILINANREAPAVFKYKGKYYLISSLCTGWDPNQALYAEADDILGDWTMKDNPCRGTGADKTYEAQSTFVFHVSGKENSYIFMADRWNKTDLENSRYLWLPLHFENGIPVIEWKKSWSLGE